jgi:hypothetical protein
VRPQKITFGEMRDMGVRGVLVYCADFHCSHSVGGLSNPVMMMGVVVFMAVVF